MRACAILLLAWATPALAQVVIVNRSSYVRAASNAESQDCYHANAGDTLVLDTPDRENGYYKVTAPDNCHGYVYAGRVSIRLNGERPAWASGGAAQPTGPVATGVPRLLNACSFNMRFIGSGDHKQYQAMADMLAVYDLVIVQELVAPPETLTFAGITIASSMGSETFFTVMHSKGFAHALSEGKTGDNNNTTRGNTSEYFVVFYKPNVLTYVPARSGFIDAPLVANNVFSRVPWKFHFRTVDGTLDFTAIDVHLKPDQGNASARKAELAFVAAHANADGERDQLIVGDMNFYTCAEMEAALPSGYSSLNAACLITNIAAVEKHPYDHVMYREQYTGNDMVNGSFEVLPLQTLMKAKWDPDDGVYPTVPPKSSAFYGGYFSDHNPVAWRMRYGVHDDD